jgi:hypothetical protein
MANEEVLFREGFTIERKHFEFELRENVRGKFLRITEDVGGRRNMIIIPAPGLQAFRDALAIITGHELPMPDTDA